MRLETATLRGTAAPPPPLDALRDYPAEVLRYTRGRGRLSWEPDGAPPPPPRRKFTPFIH